LATCLFFINKYCYLSKRKCYSRFYWGWLFIFWGCSKVVVWKMLCVCV